MDAASAIGARLARARVARGMGIEELACRTGNLTPAAVHAFETGRQSPGSEELLAMTRVLGVSVEYFFRPPSVWITAPRLLAAPAGLDVRHRDVWIVAAGDRLERHAMAVALLPSFVPPPWPLPSCAGGAEDAALTARDRMSPGAGAVADMADLAERFGVLVAPAVTDAAIDAAAMAFGWGHASAEQLAVLLNPAMARAGQRWAIARELGRCIGGARADAGFPAAFAQALLMPRALVIDWLGNGRSHVDAREVALLARRAGVPVAAARARCAEVLGVRVEDAAGACPRQDEGEAEAPSLLERMVLRGLAEGELSPGKAAELLGVARRTLEV